MPRYRQALPQLSDRLFVTDGGIETTLIFLNRRAIALIASFRLRPELQQREVVLSGNIGPRGDGYVPGAMMSVNQAADYHAEQITTFAATDADLVSAFTINYTEEAIGIARAAGWLGMPAVISFTVETDGKLPTGESLQAAIERTDLATDGYPAHYMINCAHPSHFQDALLPGSQWTRRLRGIRANASRMSHAELNEAAALDEGDPVQLGAEYRALRGILPWLSVVGGCCGTDHRHVEEMVRGAA